MLKSTNYFPHDYNARGDERIIRLLREKKWEGYGIYWAIVEKLHEAGGLLANDYETLAYDLRTSPDLIKSLIENYELFENDGKFFKSRRVLRNLKHKKLKSDMARKSAQALWHKRDTKDANAERTHSVGNAINKEINKQINNNGKKSFYLGAKNIKRLRDLYGNDTQAIKSHLINTMKFSEAEVDKALGKNF